VWLAVRCFFGNRTWLNPDEPSDLIRMRTAWEKISSSSIVVAGQCKWDRLVTVVRRSSLVGRRFCMLKCRKQGREQRIQGQRVTRNLSHKRRAQVLPRVGAGACCARESRKDPVVGTVPPRPPTGRPARCRPCQACVPRRQHDRSSRCHRCVQCATCRARVAYELCAAGAKLLTLADIWCTSAVAQSR